MTNLKSWILIVVFCALGIISSYAQRISSVYGVKLGDTESTVTSKISGSWKTTSNGKRYYESKNPSLGNCSFDDVTFWFKNGKLDAVNFSCFASGEYWGEFFSSSGYDSARSKQGIFRKKFDIMRSNLLQKYGEPYLDTEDECIWRDSDRKIRLYYEYEDVINGYNNPHCTCQVLLHYELGVGTSSVNY